MKLTRNNIITVTLLIITAGLTILLYFLINKQVNPADKTEQPADRNEFTNQPAWLIEAYTKEDRSFIEVDFVELMASEKETIDAQVEDGFCPNHDDCFVYPNGYKRNKNPDTYTIEVSPDAKIEVDGNTAFILNEIDQTNLQNPFGNKLRIPFEKMVAAAEKLTPKESEGPAFKPWKTFVYIDAEKGIVTRIFEPYQE